MCQSCITKAGKSVNNKTEHCILSTNVSVAHSATNEPNIQPDTSDLKASMKKQINT